MGVEVLAIEVDDRANRKSTPLAFFIAAGGGSEIFAGGFNPPVKYSTGVCVCRQAENQEGPCCCKRYDDVDLRRLRQTMHLAH